MEIENIKALVEGKKLNTYQIALAKLEFDKLIASQGTPNQALSMSGVGSSYFCDCKAPALIGNSMTDEVLCVKCNKKRAKI